MAQHYANHEPSNTERYPSQTRRAGLIALGTLLLLVVLGVGIAAARGALFKLPNRPFVGASGSSDEQGETSVVPSDASSAADIVAQMTLEQKIAQMFVVSPESIIDIGQATAAGDATRQALQARPVGGIIYFSQNLLEPEQTRTMLRNTQQFSQEITGLPLFLCVDEEGGTVSRIASNPAFGVEDPGNMRAIGDAGDISRAEQAARTTGATLRNLGFNVNFAPVADIANTESTVMSLRVFGNTADAVSPMVAAQVRGYKQAGVLPCAKHFPGIGGAADAHDGVISTSKSLDELRSEEFLPFKEAISAGTSFVMMGHIDCVEATGSDLPASLNPQLVSALRSELGFSGIVITDSLSMGAISSRYTPAQAAPMAVEAGNDMLLIQDSYDLYYQALLEAVRSGQISEERIDESVTRIVETKLHMGA